MKTLTEKRFFEWHEDDKSVTLRNRGGSYGGGAKSSLSTLPRQSRSIVCHGLQMGTTRTSNAREVDSMCEVIGLDFYNQCTTGGGIDNIKGGSRKCRYHALCTNRRRR